MDPKRPKYKSPDMNNKKRLMTSDRMSNTEGDGDDTIAKFKKAPKKKVVDKPNSQTEMGIETDNLTQANSPIHASLPSSVDLTAPDITKKSNSSWSRHILYVSFTLNSYIIEADNEERKDRSTQITDHSQTQNTHKVDSDAASTETIESDIEPISTTNDNGPTSVFRPQDNIDHHAHITKSDIETREGKLAETQDQNYSSDEKVSNPDDFWTTMKPDLAKHETKTLIRRIETLSNVTDDDRLIYSVERIPENIKWGFRDPLGLNSHRVITFGKTNKPIVIYVVGKVSQMWFTQQPGSMLPSSLYIVPITEGTTKRAYALLTSLSKPPTTTVESTLTEIKFARFTPVDPITGTRERFSNCWDATKSFDKDFVDMEHLPSEDLKLLDTVVVVAKICRFRTDRSDDKTRGGSAGSSVSFKWLSWRTVFELEAVCLLKSHIPEVKVIPKNTGAFGQRFL
ncbi:hypothetical protein HWV62_19361 [Athelia sp. TMB]|nr:hypothetical protein HWV62_19361 [Athelia sp. TMB]